MDKIIQKTQKKSISKWWLAFGVAIALPSLAYVVGMNRSGAELDASQLIYSDVHEGSLDVTINAYGILVSENKKLLTALTSATVEEIVLKPGALVDEGSVIVRLNNPTVLATEKNAFQTLEQERANLRKLDLNHKREILDEKSQLVELSNRYRSVELNRNALLILKKQGVVSDIKYDEVDLELKNLQKQKEILQERMGQLQLVQAEEKSIQRETISQAERNHATQRRYVEALNVRAGMQGVLQRLSVELGQRLNEGAVIALVGSIDNLTAQLKVSQVQAEKIAIGQKVVVDTRRDKIVGKVFRIDPTVEEGTVTIEASLDSPIPPSARPDLSVDGKIHIDSFPNTRYVERPVNIQENTTSRVFVVSDDRKYATSKVISFGREAGKYVQILDGLQPEDKLVVSDLSLYKNMETIVLK